MASFFEELENCQPMGAYIQNGMLHAIVVAIVFVVVAQVPLALAVVRGDGPSDGR